MLIMYFSCFMPMISGIEYRVSTTVRDNKIYTIYQDRKLDYVKSKVYELEEGPAVNIANSEITFELGHFPKEFRLVFIDILDNSLDSHNKLWVKAQLDQSVKQYQSSSYMNWVGYIKLDDMSLKADSSVIKFPSREDFPIDKYTTNMITNEFGSTLYITGGELYTKKDDIYSSGNSFFKYNLTTKEWVDMTYSFNRKLKPMVGHKSVVIDNRYLFILGGYIERSINSSEKLNGNRSISKYYSLYNLTVYDTFTNSLNSINIKPDLFDTNVATFQFNNFLATVYKDKAIVLGGFVGEGGSNSFVSNSYVGVLDYNSKTWTWNQILRDDGDKYYYDTLGSDLLVYNDNLIILPGNPQSYPIQIYDMISHRIKSNIELTDPSNTKYWDKVIHTYTIVLIVISCTVLLPSLIYFLYRKYKNKANSKNVKTKYNGPMREVWSNPDINNTQNIITLDIKERFEY